MDETELPEEAEDFIPAEDSVEEVEAESKKKSTQEVALEVISGHWGRGRNRTNRLQAAGYDVGEVSAEMSKIFNR